MIIGLTVRIFTEIVNKCVKLSTNVSKCCQNKCRLPQYTYYTIIVSHNYCIFAVKTIRY